MTDRFAIFGHVDLYCLPVTNNGHGMQVVYGAKEAQTVHIRDIPSLSWDVSNPPAAFLHVVQLLALWKSQCSSRLLLD
jgi:hypothetical protein